MITEILLKPTVVIGDEQYRVKAIRIIKKAEDAYLISQAVKSQILMEIIFEVKPL